MFVPVDPWCVGSQSVSSCQWILHPSPPAAPLLQQQLLSSNSSSSPQKPLSSSLYELQSPPVLDLLHPPTLYDPITSPCSPPTLYDPLQPTLYDPSPPPAALPPCTTPSPPPAALPPCTTHHLPCSPPTLYDPPAALPPCTTPLQPSQPVRAPAASPSPTLYDPLAALPPCTTPCSPPTLYDPLQPSHPPSHPVRPPAALPPRTSPCSASCHYCNAPVLSARQRNEEIPAQSRRRRAGTMSSPSSEDIGYHLSGSRINTASCDSKTTGEKPAGLGGGHLPDRVPGAVGSGRTQHLETLEVWNIPAPSPFPNFDYRYLQEKYGTSFSEVRQKRVAANNHRRASTASSRKPSLAWATLRTASGSSDTWSDSGVRAKQTAGQSVGFLHIMLHQGKDLLEREEGDFPGCFIRVSLGPEEFNVGVTRVQTNAFTVIFDERFSVPLDLSTLEEYSLRFAAFGIDSDERNISAGVAELKLSDLDLTIRPFNAWLYLQDVNKAVDAVGEILLSLSYLPTAERLTVVVAKCKNLVWTNSKNTADPFVKVYLLQDGRKISKKKTSTKRDDTNPIFNEAMIFSVPSLVLQELSLRVTVAEATDDGRGENLGHVIIGPEASGIGITHWNQMLATLRKPVSMWHPLRRI
ncbi:hypothetical protein WMY93_022299 [Mugilogobius chulae]|uniref:C2 domain-containing protein n=1 Tax=Mugilogobius chulae TaxID=88201 RepID=A0AAW0NHT5_9GOBI